VGIVVGVVVITVTVCALLWHCRKRSEQPKSDNLSSILLLDTMMSVDKLV
jgi:hypothetical protein